MIWKIEPHTSVQGLIAKPMKVEGFSLTVRLKETAKRSWSYFFARRSDLDSFLEQLIASKTTNPDEVWAAPEAVEFTLEVIVGKKRVYSGLSWKHRLELHARMDAAREMDADFEPDHVWEDFMRDRKKRGEFKVPF